MRTAKSDLGRESSERATSSIQKVYRNGRFGFEIPLPAAGERSRVAVFFKREEFLTLGQSYSVFSE